ncbi:LysR substrate-binding domain-containing protein [Croceicoccus mobilis]|nr:LysR substrate-binding domain-containing protein [Croceicoccus mobilis]
MTLEQLRIFIAVAEREHVTRAAKALNLTQSAVSATISALEDRHGVHLFDRIGRGIALNEVGRAFLDEARSVLTRAEQARRMLDDFGGLKRGLLSIVASQTIAGYWLPPIIARFRARFPGITVELSIGNSREAAAKVRDGVAELGFIEGLIEDPAVARWQVDEDQLALIGTDLPERLDDETLPKLPWLVREQGSGTRAAFAAAMEARGLDIDAFDLRLTLPSNEALLTAAAAGAGVTVLSLLVAGRLIATGAVQAAPFALPPRPFYALRHKERYQSQAAQAFVEMVGSTR